MTRPTKQKMTQTTKHAESYEKGQDGNGSVIKNGNKGGGVPQQ